MRDASIIADYGIDPLGFTHFSASRGKQEFHGPCWSTTCRSSGGNRDRMTVTLGSFKHTDLGLFRCRICELSGKLDDLVKGNDIDWSKVKDEQKQAAEIAAQEEEAKREMLRSWLHTDNVAQKLHEAIWDYPEILDGLSEEGITQDFVKHFQVGYSDKFNYHIDGERQNGPALSFPVYFENQIVNIRMRLLDQVKGNKYRPIRAGLGIQFFSAIYPSDRRLFIVEGEKKAIVLYSYGISCIGLYGVEVWKPEWGKYLNKRFDIIYVLFDGEPNKGVIRASTKVCRDTGGKPLWVPGKPDDFINQVRNLNTFFESMKGVPSA